MGFVRKLIINWLCSLGFINDRRMLVHGSKDRLHCPQFMYGPSVLFNTNSGSITVGERVMFGHNVMVLTGQHPFNGADYTTDAVANANDIIIKDGCWIASGAIILGGVTIGERSLVCAGAVVTNDVPDDTMVAGVPARTIKKLRSGVVGNR